MLQGEEVQVTRKSVAEARERVTKAKATYRQFTRILLDLRNAAKKVYQESPLQDHRLRVVMLVNEFSAMTGAMLTTVEQAIVRQQSLERLFQEKEDHRMAVDLAREEASMVPDPDEGVMNLCVVNTANVSKKQ